MFGKKKLLTLFSFDAAKIAQKIGSDDKKSFKAYQLSFLYKIQGKMNKNPSIMGNFVQIYSSFSLFGMCLPVVTPIFCRESSRRMMFPRPPFSCDLAWS